MLVGAVLGVELFAKLDVTEMQSEAALVKAAHRVTKAKDERKNMIVPTKLRAVAEKIRLYSINDLGRTKDRQVGQTWTEAFSMFATKLGCSSTVADKYKSVGKINSRKRLFLEPNDDVTTFGGRMLELINAEDSSGQRFLTQTGKTYNFFYLFCFYFDFVFVQERGNQQIVDESRLGDSPFRICNKRK